MVTVLRLLRGKFPHRAAEPRALYRAGNLGQQVSDRRRHSGSESFLASHWRPARCLCQGSSPRCRTTEECSGTGELHSSGAVWSAGGKIDHLGTAPGVHETRKRSQCEASGTAHCDADFSPTCRLHRSTITSRQQSWERTRKYPCGWRSFVCFSPQADRVCSTRPRRAGPRRECRRLNHFSVITYFPK